MSGRRWASGGWFFDDEDGTDWSPIPADTILGTGEAAVFFDTQFTTEATFRTAWSVPSSVQVVALDLGSLATNSPSNTNEVLTLFDDFSVQQDLVNYDDSGDWPSNANGPSTYLTDLSADNSERTGIDHQLRSGVKAALAALDFVTDSVAGELHAT